MGGVSLSHLSDIATQETNTPGVTTPILSVSPENGTDLQLRNYADHGDEAGFALYLKLRDSNGDPLPTDTSLVLRVERPTDDTPIAVSVKVDNIAAWNQTPVGDQSNEENVDAVKIELQGSEINIGQNDVLTFDVVSSAQIDWDKSELYTHRPSVREN